MEKLTVTHIGAVKVVNYINKKTTKPDSFNKVGFQSQEHGLQWFDFTFRGECPLVVGQNYEFETSSREYNGKTYWDAKLPKKEDKLNVDMEKIKNELVGIKLRLLSIEGKLAGKKDDYPTAESEGIDLDKTFPDDEQPPAELYEEDAQNA